MNLERSLKAVLLAALPALLVPASSLFGKIPDAQLSTWEKELTNLSCTPLIIAAPPARPSFSGLDWPFRLAGRKESPGAGATRGAGAAPAGAKGVPLGPLPPPLPSFDRLPILSMVYVEGTGLKTAIIDGQVLQEGSWAGRHQVLRIEESRVLVRQSGKDTWLRLEQ